MTRAVLSSFLYLPVGGIGNDEITSLRNDLTVTPKFGGSSIQLFDERVKWFGVPTYHFHPLPFQVEDRRVVSPISFNFRGKLRHDQEQLTDKFVVNFNAGKTGFIIEAKPGYGKTTVGIYLMSILKQTTLVVVPRSNLIRQWRERLLHFSDIKPNEIGWVEGGRGDWRGKKVVIGLVHSLVLDRFPVDFRRSFGCVIFDEVDRSVPPQTFAPAVAMFPAKYRIGMSAVLKRSDGMEVVFQKHIGQAHLKGGEEGRMSPTIIIHYYSKSSGFVYPGSSRLNRRGMILSRLASNPDRMSVVSNYINLIWKSGRKCLVLSDRKKQLVSIRQTLMRRGIPDRDIGYYMRSLYGNKPMSDRDRKRVASACRIILGTFQMIALGTDIPDLAGLVYATPQSEVIQSQGRIERALDGKKKPVVVDIVDSAYNDCLGWAQKRLRYYRSQGLEVKEK